MGRPAGGDNADDWEGGADYPIALANCPLRV